MSLATVASIVGIAAGADTLLGGGGGSGGNAAGGTYVPIGRGMTDQQWQQLMPLIAASIQKQQGNISGPVNAGYAATQPGGQFGNLPSQFQAFGNANINSARQDQANQGLLSSGGNQVFQTALDPQNALRDKLQQQVTDASRAGTSARGIGMSPEASGIENQDVSNFLINWQNQQLGRQLAGLQGEQGAMSASGNLGQQAGTALGQAGQQFNAGAMFPFETAGAYTGALQGPENAFAQLSPQLLSYLGLGNNSSQQAFGNNQLGLSSLINAFTNLGGSGTQFPAPIDSSGNTQANTSGNYAPVGP